MIIVDSENVKKSTKQSWEITILVKTLKIKLRITVDVLKLSCAVILTTVNITGLNNLAKIERRIV